jgi:hypothetical protein
MKSFLKIANNFNLTMKALNKKVSFLIEQNGITNVELTSILNDIEIDNLEPQMLFDDEELNKILLPVIENFIRNKVLNIHRETHMNVKHYFPILTAFAEIRTRVVRISWHAKAGTSVTHHSRSELLTGNMADP